MEFIIASMLMSFILMLLIFVSLFVSFGMTYAEGLETSAVVWAIETKVVRDMKSGKVTTFQHESKFNRDGYLEEDMIKDPDGMGTIKTQYEYDNYDNVISEKIMIMLGIRIFLLRLAHARTHKS